MARLNEVGDVAPERQGIWLAAQIDELEAVFIQKLDALTNELGSLKRVLIGLLIAIIVAIVSIPVGIIYAAAFIKH